MASQLSVVTHTQEADTVKVFTKWESSASDSDEIAHNIHFKPSVILSHMIIWQKCSSRLSETNIHVKMRYCVMTNV